MMITDSDTLFQTITRIYQLGIKNNSTLSLRSFQGMLTGKLNSIAIIINNLEISVFNEQFNKLQSEVNALKSDNLQQTTELYDGLLNDIDGYLKENNTLQMLKDKIADFPITIGNYRLFFETLKYFTIDELQELAQKLSSMNDATIFIATLKNQINTVKPEPSINAITLLGYINQNILDRQLEKLNHTYSHDSECTRIIITTTEVIFGLNTILNYLESRDISLDELITSKITAEEVLRELPNGGNDVLSSFEIAWGLLDSLYKHKRDNPFITTSFQVAKEVIPGLAKKATLVIDCHGGSKFVVCGDYNRIQNNALSHLMSDLLASDRGNNIDHVILQSCRSGKIKLHALSKINIHIKDIGKSVVTITRADNQLEKFFDAESTSSIFWDAITSTKREDIAFSFSENLINPANVIGQGNLGIPAAELGEARIDWPTNVGEKYTVAKGSEAKRNHWKRCTIAADNSHRKLSDNRFTLFNHGTKVDESLSPLTLEHDRSCATSA